MKTLIIVFTLLIASSGFAQNYEKYLKEGIEFLKDETTSLKALERFDLAYEFAKTPKQKETALDYKKKSREQINQFQEKLKKARTDEFNAKEAALRATDSVITATKLANDAKAKTDTLRNIALAKSLAFQAIKVHQDNLKSTTQLADSTKQLPLIIAYYAWYFNDKYHGNPFDPDIFAALSEVSNTTAKLQGDSIHTDIIRDIVFSKSGKLFASCSDDGSVNKFVFPENKNDGNSLRINPVNMDMPKTENLYYFRSLVFSPDEKWIIAGTYQGEILYWNIQNKKPFLLIEPARSVNKSANKSINKLLALNKSSQLLSVSSDGHIRWWNFDDFLKNGNKDYKAKTLVKDTVIVGEKLTTAVSNTDESKIAVASETGMLRIFDSNSHEKLDSCKCDKGKILSLCWTNKNELIIGFENGWIEIRNEKNLKLNRENRVHESGVTDIHFDNDSIISRMITSSYDGKIKIRNYDKIDSEPALINGHSDWVSCIALTKDNSMVISGSADKSILISKININDLKDIILKNIPEKKNMSSYNWNKYVGQDIEYAEKLPLQLKVN